MKLAVSALEDKVEWAGVTEVAVPHDQGAIRLDHLEGMGTVALDGHREENRQFLCGFAPPTQAGSWQEEVD